MEIRKEIAGVLKYFSEEALTTDEAIDSILRLLGVSQSYVHINDAAALIKSMPADQAIQKMKAALSGQPETTIIDGELLISYHNAR